MHAAQTEWCWLRDCLALPEKFNEYKPFTGSGSMCAGWGCWKNGCAVHLLATYIQQNGVFRVQAPLIDTHFNTARWFFLIICNCLMISEG